MLHKILVPLDGSRLSDRILNQVRRLLVREDARVMLLRVQPSPLQYPYNEERRRVLVQTQEHLEGLCESLCENGARATYTLLDAGDPATKILDFAKRYNPSLLAMTTHGRSGIRRMLRGSVAERVLRNARHPLLLWNPFRPTGVGKGGGPRFARILVPLDGSSESAGILPLVRSLAELNEAKVILLHIQELYPLSSEYPGALPMLTPEEALKILSPYRRQLGSIPVKLRTEVGLPASGILDVAQEEHADLLALSSHGRTGVSRWAFGSVTEAVLRHCPLPLLVTRTRPG